MNLDRYTETAAEAIGAHPPTYTEHAADPTTTFYCPPCSQERGDWVTWTPEHAACVALAAVYDDIRRDVAEEIAQAIEGGLPEVVNVFDRTARSRWTCLASAAFIAREHATSHTSPAETRAGVDAGGSGGQGDSEAQRGAQGCGHDECRDVDYCRFEIFTEEGK